MRPQLGNISRNRKLTLQREHRLQVQSGTTRNDR